ncbi:hypothetical protein RFI_03549, partial [Reticulomyxa filosa]
NKLRFFGRTLNAFEESNNFKKQEKKIFDLTNSQRNYGLNTKRSSIDCKVDGNVKAMNRLGQFPCYNIRKWHVVGIQFKKLHLCFAQRQVSLYRSVFDSSSVQFGYNLCQLGKSTLKIERIHLIYLAYRNSEI